MSERVSKIRVDGTTVDVFRTTKHDQYKCRNCRHITPAVSGCAGRWCKRLFFATRLNYVCYRYEAMRKEIEK